MGQAAQLLRVSPETVRRWAETGRLPAGPGPDGSRIVDGVVLAAFAKDRVAGLHPLPSGTVVTSVRNSFAGIVTAVQPDDVGRWRSSRVRTGVVSVVTGESVEELGITVGATVTARVKSTEVHIDLT